MDLTKSLRARDQRLLSLLPIARELFDGKLNIYFPQRNEWLLEWLAQRLKEEDDPAARASPESWRLLRNLLGAVGDWNAVAAILKRHSVVAAVARAFAELRKRLGEEEYATPREMALGQEEEEEEAVVQTLRGVMEVLETLREPARKNGAMIVATKMPVESSAALLGDFFAVCEVFLGRMISIENGWVDNVLWLWRSSVWGNPNTKKVCLYRDNRISLWY